MNSVTGESRSREFFKKNIGIAIQRGNADSIMGSYPPADKFYIL